MKRANAELLEQEPNLLPEIEEANKAKSFPVEEQATPELMEMSGGKQTEFLRRRRIMEERDAERLRLKKIAEGMEANVQRIQTEGNENGKLKQIRL